MIRNLNKVSSEKLYSLDNSWINININLAGPIGGILMLGAIIAFFSN